MTIDKIISILRNPWGSDSQAIMTARIEAADLLEKMPAVPVAAQPQDERTTAKLAVGVHVNRGGATVAVHLKQGDLTTVLYCQDHPANKETLGVVELPAGLLASKAAQQEAVAWNEKAALTVLGMTGDGPYGQSDVEEAIAFLKAAEIVRKNIIDAAQPAQDKQAGQARELPASDVQKLANNGVDALIREKNATIRAYQATIAQLQIAQSSPSVAVAAREPGDSADGQESVLIEAQCDDCCGSGVQGEFTSHDYDERICDTCDGIGKIQVRHAAASAQQEQDRRTCNHETAAAFLRQCDKLNVIKDGTVAHIIAVAAVQSALTAKEGGKA